MMRDEDFASAVANFERAIERGAPAVTWSYLAESNQALSRYSEAVVAWDRFLASVTPEVSPALVTRAREQRRLIAARCTRVRLRFQPENAELIINGRLANTRRSWSMVNAAGAREVLLDPGEYRITLRAVGYVTWSQVFTAPEDGSERSFDLRLARNEAQPGTVIGGRNIPWWSFLGGGIFVAGAATGGTLLGLRAAAEATCGSDTTCLQRMAADGNARNLGIGISFTVAAGGLILCVAGIVDGTRPPTLAPVSDFQQSAAMRTP